jgi:hypothetical protein
MEKQQWTALTTSRLEEKRTEKKSSYVDAHVAIARTHAKTPRQTHAKLIAARRKHK